MPKAIVGLGNPGPEYERTRHNAGFMAVDFLAARWGLGSFRRADHAVAASGTVAGTAVRLIKPTTFMNASGDALAVLRSPSWDPAADLLIVVDDTALPLAQLRLRGAGSAGGHNGLKSVEAALRRQDYARLRIGVGGKPPEYDDLADWVLGRMTSDERAAIDAQMDTIADAAECWLTEGIERAMSRFNR
ncbi:MAG TPA: aminoacyl-tRNA hydrolase [Gemmatimonadales bacterium]|nr:aminoacyl-tRNA hydrolase [Gemmatimonadales bacterium]